MTTEKAENTFIRSHLGKYQDNLVQLLQNVFGL